jgi:hypothetical protein
MDESTGWGLRRYVTLLGVLVVHMALLTVLVMASRTRSLSASASDPIQLLSIPPAALPRIRAENSPPRRLSGDTALSVAAPVLGFSSPSQSPPASGADGNGSGVDWAAEARRALQAFEIRNHQPPSSSVSGAPEEDLWWPRARHRAGDRFKTASGDWIVWVNSSCYQVASSAAPAYAPGAMLSQTFCPNESDPPRPDPRPGR